MRRNPPSAIHQAIGRAVQQERLRQDAKLTAVAAAAGIQRNNLYSMEGGQLGWTPDTLTRVAHALGTSGSTLLRAAEVLMGESPQAPEVER